MRKKFWFLSFVMFCFCLSAGEKGYTEVFLKKSTKEISYPVIGNVKPLHISKISAQVSGRIQNVFVDVGDRVEKGEVLVSLDPTFFEIDLKRQTALCEVASLNYEEAEMEYQRLKPLWEKDVGQEPTIAAKTFDDAKIRKKQKKALLDQATADLENTKQRLKETSIVAPYTGVITKRFVECGDSVAVAPAVNILEIMEDLNLIFEFSLPQDLLGQVSVGSSVSLQIPEVKNVVGKIKTIFPQIEENSRTFKCQVLIENPEKKLHPGLLLKALVVQETKKECWTLPIGAVVQKDQTFCVKVKEGDKIVFKAVEIGQMREKEVEILRGIDEKTICIIEK